MGFINVMKPTGIRQMGCETRAIQLFIDYVSFGYLEHWDELICPTFDNLFQLLFDWYE
jgi:hypothetical protein